MSKYLIDDTTLISIGDAIRAKEGSNAVIRTSDMADRIRGISAGGSISVTDDGDGNVIITTSIPGAFVVE